MTLEEGLAKFMPHEWWQSPTSGIWHGRVGDALLCGFPNDIIAKTTRLRDEERVGFCCAHCSRRVLRFLAAFGIETGRASRAKKVPRRTLLHETNKPRRSRGRARWPHRTDGLCAICGVNPKRQHKSRWAAYCARCAAAYMRQHRPRHSELTPEQRLRANCRTYTNVLLKRGKLMKGPCVDCGSDKVQAHHADYRQPRSVTWLCRPCHLKRHEKEAAA